jgi:hypothetical protein
MPGMQAPILIFLQAQHGQLRHGTDIGHGNT